MRHLTLSKASLFFATFLSCMLSVVLVYAQSSSMELTAADSNRLLRLHSQLDAMSDSPAKVDSLMKLGAVYYNTSQPTVLHFSLEGLKLSEKIQYHEGTESTLLKSIICLSNLGKKDSMMLFIDKYFAHIPHISDSHKIANGFGIIGRLLKNVGESDRAFDVLTTSAEIAERNEMTELALIQYNRLSNLVVVSDIPEARRYMEKTYELAKQLNDPKYIGRAALNLAILNDSTAQIQGYLDIAKEAGKQANNRPLLAGVFAMQADMTDDVKEAIRLKEKALEYLDKSIDQGPSRAARYHSLAGLYLKDHRYEDAKAAYKESLNYYVKNTDAWGYADGLKGYAQAMRHLNNPTMAFDSLDKAYHFLTKYYDNLREENITEVNKKYQIAKVEKELAEKELIIANEKSKRLWQLLITLGILGLGLIASIVVMSRIRRRRREMAHRLEIQRLEASTLKELDEMKSRWFENISHDIRTPLTLISAPIKDALKAAKTNYVKDLLSIADRNSKNLLHLTNEMLELAKLENTSIPILKKSKMANMEVAKMVHAFDSFAADRNVVIDTDIDIPAEQVISMDYDKYEKIFNNLFKNAIQYSPADSSVAVKISIIDDTLVTTIIDQGAGIPPDEVPHLFDKYFRASHQQTKRVEGSGLGLAIVKELIDVLKGTIVVDSKVNEGTTFTYAVPIQLRAGQDVPKLDKVSPIPEEVVQGDILIGNDHSILLVEDNYETLNYLSTTLGRRFDIDTAENALIALQKLESEKYDLIISDIMMPGLDGYTFKKRVNALSHHRDTPFIFLSAKALDEDKLEGLKLGIDDYITKPFVTEELLIRINNLLGRHLVRKQEFAAGEDEKEQESSQQQSIATRAISIIESHLQDPNFGVETLSTEISYSASQLNRLLKKETGLTTVQFILEVRLQRARKLLLSNEVYSVKEVQHQVGILSQSYFSRKYTERFGSTPGSLL